MPSRPATERAAGSCKIVGRMAGPRCLVLYGLVSGHKTNLRPVLGRTAGHLAAAGSRVVAVPHKTQVVAQRSGEVGRLKARRPFRPEAPPSVSGSGSPSQVRAIYLDQASKEARSEEGPNHPGGPGHQPDCSCVRARRRQRCNTGSKPGPLPAYQVGDAEGVGQDLAVWHWDPVAAL